MSVAPGSTSVASRSGAPSGGGGDGAPLRVLHVVDGVAPQCGGTATAAISLATAQRRVAGIDTRVLSIYHATHPSEPPAALRDAGVPVTMVGPVANRLGRHPSLRAAMTSAINEGSPVDVVHVHGVWGEVQYRAARCAAAAGVPYVWAPHGMLDPWSLQQSRLRKRLFLALRVRRAMNGAAAIHYQSEVERDLAATVGLRPRTIVESPGLDLSEFATMPPRGAFRARFPQLADGRPIVLFLGRLHYKKNPDLLIRAFAKADLPANATLAFVGPVEDAYRAQLDAVVRDAGLADDRVLFAGMLVGVDRVAALQDADLFVLPSQQENFGIAVVEALAAGTPVLISDKVNIHGEVVRGGVGGVAPLAVDALADALRAWMSDPARRASAAAGAPAFVARHYDLQVVARHWLGHYASLITRASSEKGGDAR